MQADILKRIVPLRKAKGYKHAEFGAGLKPELQPLRGDVVYRKHARILTRLKVGKGYSPKSWRHRAVIALYNSRAPTKDVQNHARHSRLEMTANYLKSLGVELSSTAAHNFPALLDENE